MSQFYLVNESTEDTLQVADNLQDAIRAARELATHGRAGDPVSVLESGGTAVKQFVLLPDGTVVEQPIICSARPAAVAKEPTRSEAAFCASLFEKLHPGS